MSMRKKVRLQTSGRAIQFTCLLILVLMSLSAVQCWAQEVTATITGTITDPSGAPCRARK